MTQSLKLFQIYQVGLKGVNVIIDLSQAFFVTTHFSGGESFIRLQYVIPVQTGILLAIRELGITACAGMTYNGQFPPENEHKPFFHVGESGIYLLRGG